jgi:hypothetical protein
MVSDFHTAARSTVTYRSALALLDIIFQSRPLGQLQSLLGQVLTLKAWYQGDGSEDHARNSNSPTRHGQNIFGQPCSQIE